MYTRIWSVSWARKLYKYKISNINNKKTFQPNRLTKEGWSKKKFQIVLGIHYSENLSLATKMLVHKVR